VRRAYALALLCLLLPAAVSCDGFFGPQKRAAAYYSHMAGLTPRVSYSSFLSPAYRKQLGAEGVKALDDAHGKASEATTRYPRAAAADIGVEEKAGFAWTSVNPLLGDAYANLEPVRWVHVGMGWYLYLGSDAEQKAYGTFPGDMGKPVAPRIEPKPPKRRADKG
jgi:hypothetical protein